MEYIAGDGKVGGRRYWKEGGWREKVLEGRCLEYIAGDGKVGGRRYWKEGEGRRLYGIKVVGGRRYWKEGA